LKKLRQLLRFFIYSNLFIAAVALLMVRQTSIVFLEGHVVYDYLNFVFFASLCSYNFHYFLTEHSVLPSPRVEWIRKYKLVLLFLFLAGLVGAAWFGWRLRSFWPWLIPSVVATFLYSAPKIPHHLFRSLRKVAIGKTIFLAFIWMYVTAALPLVISGKEWTTAFTIYCFSQFFFVYSICILFDYRDREDDKAEGVRSLITYLSEVNIKRLFFFSFIVAIISTSSLYFFKVPLELIILMLIPCFIVALLYKTAIRNFSDIFYYFLLDGLMALSALMMLVAGI
jgi:4-hydroxybenzoate polyprenyltransferase